MKYDNPIFLDACACKKTPRPPVWLMRQAGRYMKEYLAIKEKYSFLEMCKTPEICSQITMLPVTQLEIDAAILFSDILVTAEAMGGKLSFEKGVGPVFSNPINTPKDFEHFFEPDVDEALLYVSEGIQCVKQALKNKIPLIGFAGAPFTVLSYLIEGKGSSEFKKTKYFLHMFPEETKKMLEKIARVTAAYLKLQIKAGADALQLFDTWSGSLSWYDYEHFCHPFNQYIMNEINRLNVPIISFSKASSVFYPLMIEAKPSAISFDWNIRLENVKNKIPENIAIQGNLDPNILYAEKTVIKKRVLDMVEAMKGRQGYIFNLGHGIMPDIPFDNVRFLVDTIKNIE